MGAVDNIITLIQQCKHSEVIATISYWETPKFCNNNNNGNDLCIKSPKVCIINIISHYTIIGMIRNIALKSLEGELVQIVEGDLVQIVGVRLVTR